MLRPQLLVLVAVAIAGARVDAAQFSAYPFTPGGDTIVLGNSHPAFGAAAPKDSLSYSVSLNTTVDSEDREATSSSDLQRLNTFFKTNMVTNYQELTKYAKGAAQTSPWPSSYWPIYYDGINYAWNSQDSMPASEKYARAYGLDPQQFTTTISKTSGILSQSSRQTCTADSDCAGLNDSSACGKRKGESSGYCIPTWFGICHAWSPAAIEEREPRCPVTKNGVTFQPFDIKALVTQMYDGASLNTVFTGSRFNGPDSPLNLDSDGRYQDATRRDIGPGFFHIAIHNIMGARQKSFVVDVDQDSQVWNQPIRRYEVISATELTPAQAAQTFFAPLTTYTFNTAAQKIMFIQLKFDYITEAAENGALVSTGRVDSYTTTVYYEYVLELDGSGNIIGGEWVRDSRQKHPDFLWFPEGQPSMDAVSDVGIKYKDIRELLDASADCKTIGDASSGSDTTPAATSGDGPSAAGPAPATAPASDAPAPGTPTAVPVTATPVSPAAPIATTTPASSSSDDFPWGTVTSAGSLSGAYSAISDWLKRWMGGRGH